ncbi:MAG: hypothetical protein MJZ28_01030 [Paludibacteraceae bacterium]|nr:hypothetical protein [Paludibacteraceae bacterium]
MKFNFLKVATVLSLSAFFALTSCDKSEIESEEKPVVEQQSKTLSPFEAAVKTLSEDTSVVGFSVINPDDIYKEALRRESDRIWFSSGVEHDWYLCGLVGVETTSSNPGSMRVINGVPYTLIDVDLNMGAGGKYVYLYAAFADGYARWYGERPQAITKITPFYGSLPYDHSSVVKEVGGNYLNCNAGTKKGASIYLSVEKKDYGTSRYRGLMVAAYKSSHNATIMNPVTGTWHGLSPHMDLNKGAGGRYIYLFTL